MIDEDRIREAILATNESPLALETGANLVDSWIREFWSDDNRFEILAVELGFVLELDANTIAIGVQDAIMRDAKGVFGNEWKNVKEPRKDSRGRDSSWWNESVWLREISTGPQIGLYACALSGAKFYDREGVQYSFLERSPRVRVRAAVKSNPVRFWPDENGSGHSGVYEFDERSLAAIRAGFIAKAEQIRCARRAKILPWQLPGHQCFPFNSECPFLKKFCANREPPTNLLEGEDKWVANFDPSDPATRLALPHIASERFDNPELVILSASSYETASNCLEKYRIISGSLSEKTNDEDSKASGIAVGTVAHSGYAEVYRQMRDEQRESGRFASAPIDSV